MKINQVLKSPVLTEKATGLSQKKVYAFEVDKNANKNQIASAVTELYKVKVGAVNIQTRKGKTKRVGRRMKSKKQPDRKVAYIKVTEGTIDLFPQT